MPKSMIVKDALRPFEMKIDQLLETTVVEARGALMAGANQIAGVGSQKIPKKTGQTASKIKTKKEDAFGNTVSVGASGPEAYWMEYGTKKHEILPSTKKALKFGNTFVKRLQHPGLKARGWLRGAYKIVAPLLYARLQTILGTSIKKKI